MNVLLCIAYCLPLVLTSIVADIPNDIVDNEDFVIVDTIEDYDGNIVPSVDDEFVEVSVEDSVSEGVLDDSVVEQITVNQTVVDNSEVLQKMDILDNKLSLLNDSFNSVLTSTSLFYINPVFYKATLGPSSTTSGGVITYYLNFTDKSSDTSSYYYMYVFDVSNVDNITYFFNGSQRPDNLYLCNDFALGSRTSEYISVAIDDSSELDVSDYDYFIAYAKTRNYNLQVSYIGEAPVQPDDPSGNDPSNPSINVTYPQEVINNVNTIKNELVTLQYLTVLNITLPMIIACVKRITFPNRKEINK